MTQEEKQLLLKDLFARLPYGVKCSINGELCEIARVDVERQQLYLKKEDGHGGTYSIARGDVPKQYLRPMSSMTEEEKKEFIHYASYDIEESVNGRHYEYYLHDGVGTPEEPTCNFDAIDWLNANYFDYRDLIKRRLALEAPEGMYKTKTE